MDRNKLNNEVILCRPAIRRAKVIVIRKIIKKMKILKSCKNEALKEKKLNKAERLFARMQEIKKLKIDDVTKFALQNENYDMFLKESPKNLKTIAMATLAKHKCVSSKIAEIRKKIPNWNTELPLLLNSVKKNKLSTNVREKVQIKKHKFKESYGNILKINNNISKSKEGFTKKEKIDWQSNNPPSAKNTEVEIIKNHLNEIDCTTHKEKAKNLSLPLEQQKKMDDPFFIEKKVIVPKLLLYEKSENKKANTTSERFDHQKMSKKTNFYKTTLKAKKDPKHEDKEILHPSWAAKKVPLIKPFEGKKIQFLDD